ncbi:hypothetical protein [Glycomyces tarimensis]
MSRPMPPPHVLAAIDREYAQARQALDTAIDQVRANLQSITGPAPLPSEIYGAAAHQLAASHISHAQLVALASVAMTRILTEPTTKETS